MDNRAPELEDILAADPGQYDVLPKLNVSDEGRLSRLRNRSQQFFKEDLETIRLIQLANSLMKEPDEEMVKRIIAGNVELLKHVFPKVVLPRRIIINTTPLQLVYFARDHKMCEVLKPFFTELCGSEEAGIKEMERQIQDKIDNGSESAPEHFNFTHKIKTISNAMYPGRDPVLSPALFAEIKKYRKDFHRDEACLKEKLDGVSQSKSFDFKLIIQAISNDAHYLGRDPATNKRILSPALFAEIKKFQTNFHRSQARVIDKGIHFRLEIIQELLETYQTVAKFQWEYKYKKCALVEDAVLAWVLGYVSENDAQSFNQGLYYLQSREYQEPFGRNQKTRDGYNFYEALKKPSVDFLGLDSSCFDIVYGRERVYLCVWGRSWKGLENTIEKNFKIGRTYAATLSNETIGVYNSLRCWDNRLTAAHNN